MGNEDVQIIQDKKSGPREHGLLGEFIMILATWSSVTVEEVKKVGVSGEKCCGVKN